MTISSTFYAGFFCQYFGAKNFKAKTQICNFWRQNIGTKYACKRLMKSTPRCFLSDPGHASLTAISAQNDLLLGQNDPFWVDIEKNSQVT